jgi:hypothetical protein
VKFEYYPEEFGILIGPETRASLKPGDLEFLEELREHFASRYGEVLSWKHDISPIFSRGEMVLGRLWKNGYVVKFAKQIHTVFGNPEYIQWYIWVEENARLQQSNDGGSDPRSSPYFMP